MSIPHKNALEWAVFALSLALVLGLAGFIGYEALGAGGEAALAVELGEPVARGGRLEVPVTVHNRGDGAVEDVLVEVTVLLTGAPAERAELTVPLLAAGATEEGRVVVSAADPVERAEGNVLSYRLP
jgi:uncharacterized protein (TIGR02588 family)